MTKILQAHLLLACLVVHGCSLTGAKERAPIIDMHMHARLARSRTSTGEPLTRRCFPQPTCLSGPVVTKTDADVLALTLDAMRRYNIVLGFLSDATDIPGTGLRVGHASDYQATGSVETWVRAAPGRFFPSPMIGDPSQVDLAVLRQAYRAGKLRGMGELTNQYQGIR